MRSRFLVRLYAGFALTLALTAVLVWFFGARWAKREALSDLRALLEARAQTLAEVALPALRAVEGDAAPPALNPSVVRFGAQSETRCTILRRDGLVLADSHERPEHMDNHAGRPEVRDALEHGAGFSVRISPTVGVEMIYVAIPVRDGERVVGVARTAIRAGEAKARWRSFERALFLSVAVAAAAALLIGYRLARRVTEPLGAMSLLARAIAEGRPPDALSSERDDEIAELSRSLHAMAARLRDRHELLLRERNKLVAVLSGMVEGVIAVDEQERLLHINDAAGRLLGLTPEQSAGRSLVELVRVPKVVDMLQRCLREQHALRDEVGHLGPSADRTVELMASPLRDGSGQVHGAVLVLHDVTELRYLETVRRDFVANVSHELKTPLAALRGLIETLDDDPEIDARRRCDFLKRAREQVGRLSALVMDLLILSRLEGGEVGEREPVDLCSVVRDSAERFADEAAGRRLSLTAQLPDGEMRLLADPESLRQVVDNLLSNAIRYTPPEGEVWLRIRMEHGAIVLEVEDTGIGIEPKEQDRIFERFYRVDRARSRQLGGTGLGLSIVKHVAESLGGQVGVRSQLGRGSCFFLRLPPHEPRAGTVPHTQTGGER